MAQMGAVAMAAMMLMDPMGHDESLQKILSEHGI